MANNSSWRALLIQGKLYRIDHEPGAALAALKLTGARAGVIYYIDPRNPAQAVSTDWRAVIRTGRLHPPGGALEIIPDMDWAPPPVKIN